MSSRTTIKGWLANELTYGDQSNAKIFLDEYVGERRWVTEHRIVFQIHGELGFYTITVDRTKNDEHPCDLHDSNSEVPVKRVVPKVVPTIIYEEVED